MAYKRKADEVRTYWNSYARCPRCHSTSVKTKRYFYSGKNGNGPKRTVYLSWCTKCGLQAKPDTKYYKKQVILLRRFSTIKSGQRINGLYGTRIQLFKKGRKVISYNVYNYRGDYLYTGHSTDFWNDKNNPYRSQSQGGFKQPKAGKGYGRLW